GPSRHGGWVSTHAIGLVRPHADLAGGSPNWFHMHPFKCCARGGGPPAPMTNHPEPPRPPEREHPAGALPPPRAELADADGARIGQGTVVHGLTTHMWAGIEVPAVACHAAVDPLRLHAAAGPVTCRRCLGRSRGVREQVPGQTSLL